MKIDRWPSKCPGGSRRRARPRRRQLERSAFVAGPRNRRSIARREKAGSSIWRSRQAQGVAQLTHAALEFLIDAPKLSSTLQFISGQAEPCQYAHEDEAVPDLQPPADGFEEHRQPRRE